METSQQSLATIERTFDLERKQDALTPAELIRIAVSQNADIDKLAKLMDLQERWERNEAKKAFISALNAFKANPPNIIKNGSVSFGDTSYKYATLDHVCDEVTKALSRHGITHRWKVEQDKDLITVTCILTHELGHSEETKLQGSPDNSGKKNSIQSIGSTVTYLQRYTLMAATGLAAANGDDDGRGASKLPDLEERLRALEACATLEELSRIFKNMYKDAVTCKDFEAQKRIVAVKDKRKRELQ